MKCCISQVEKVATTRFHLTKVNFEYELKAEIQGLLPLQKSPMVKKELLRFMKS